MLQILSVKVYRISVRNMALQNFVCMYLVCLFCLVLCENEESLNLIEAFNNLKHEIQSEKANLEKSMAKMSAEIQTQKIQMKRMNDENKKLRSDVAMLQSKRCDCHGNNEHNGSLRKRLSTENVAFSVRLSHDVSNLADGMTIIYDEKVSDFGNNYDNSDGIFTAPVTGVYVFTWTFVTQNDRNEETILVKSGNTMAYSYSDSSDNDGTQSTNTVVIQVNAREHVMIRAASWSVNSHVLELSRANTFSGWLLWAL